MTRIAKTNRTTAILENFKRIEARLLYYSYNIEYDARDPRLHVQGTSYREYKVADNTRAKVSYPFGHARCFYCF